MTAKDEVVTKLTGDIGEREVLAIRSIDNVTEIVVDGFNVSIEHGGTKWKIDESKSIVTARIVLWEDTTPIDSRIAVKRIEITGRKKQIKNLLHNAGYGLPEERINLDKIEEAFKYE